MTMTRRLFDILFLLIANNIIPCQRGVVAAISNHNNLDYASIIQDPSTTGAPSPPPPPPPPSHLVVVSVLDWFNTTAVSSTISTLQVVSNPVLNRQTSPVAETLFQQLHALNADLVRYVPWFPYPLVAVAELEPPEPKSRTTHWNFTEELKQQFYDVWEAVVGSSNNSNWSNNNNNSNNNKEEKKNQNRLVINFSTQPTWMFNTTKWDYSNEDPNDADWAYPRGNFIPSTTPLVSQYYGRLASWIIKGSFQDEFGHTISGGPAYGDRVTHWEVFNEPEAEHGLSIEDYNTLYDGVVQEIRRQADPDHHIQFMGMAISNPARWDYWEGFLNLTNHHPSVRDAISNGFASFHFYAPPPSRTNISTFGATFDKIPPFLETVDRIVRIRNRLSPTTKLACDETGVIPPDDNRMDAPPSPPLYFNMVAGIYTVLWGEMSVRGIDVVASSQYCGCPAIPEWDIPNRQYPGVSMTNWTTGMGNPRYWALKLILEFFGPGDRIVESSSSSSSSSSFSFGDDIHGDNTTRNSLVYHQARVTAKSNQRALILVNKSHLPQTMILSTGEEDGDNKNNKNKSWKGAQIHVVDGHTHDGPWRTYTLHPSELLMLEPFAVVVVLGRSTIVQPTRVVATSTSS